MANFSDNLRKLMGERSLTAAELARKTGLSEAAISGYINGKKEPRGAQSILLAKALDVTLDELWQTGFEIEKSGNVVTVTVEEKALLERMRLLNQDGITKAKTYVDDLLNSGHENPILTAAPTAPAGVVSKPKVRSLKIAARSGGVSELSSKQKRDRKKVVDGLKGNA